jgi:histidinol-phosphate aminotransferase
MKLPFTSIVDSLPATIPFVAPEAIERRTGIPFKVRVGANESAFGISPKAYNAMVGAIGRISNYNDPENHELREALADYHKVTLNHISVGAGIDDLLGLAVRAFIGTGDVTASSLGSYPTFHFHVAGFGGKSHTVPYQSNGFNNLEALSEAANQTEAKMVYLANPDNPAGTWHNASDLESFIGQLPRNCVCILDEAYIEFAPEGTAFPIQNLDPRIILMRTFSKAHGMAGARVGYALADPEIITAFNKVRLHFNVNLVAQTGALASLLDPDFVQNVVQAVDEGRSDYVALAKSLGMQTLPSATNFVTIDCDNQPRAQAILENLAKKGVFVRKPGTAPLDRCIRVTVGTPEERRACAQIFPEVLSEVDAAS